MRSEPIDRQPATTVMFAQQTEPVGPAERRVVGLNVYAAAFAASCVAGAFVFAWGFLSRPPNGSADLANVLAPLCLVGVYIALIGQARIVVDGAGFIEMVGPLLIRRVPIADVAGIETDSGVALRLVSGRRIGTVAYQLGRGSRPHQPFFLKAAERLDRAIHGFPGDGAPTTPRPDHVEIRLNRPALTTALAASVLLIGGTFALNAWMT